MVAEATLVVGLGLGVDSLSGWAPDTWVSAAPYPWTQGRLEKGHSLHIGHSSLSSHSAKWGSGGTGG